MAVVVPREFLLAFAFFSCLFDSDSCLMILQCFLFSILLLSLRCFHVAGGKEGAGRLLCIFNYGFPPPPGFAFRACIHVGIRAGAWAEHEGPEGLQETEGGRRGNVIDRTTRARGTSGSVWTAEAATGRVALLLVPFSRKGGKHAVRSGASGAVIGPRRVTRMGGCGSRCVEIRAAADKDAWEQGERGRSGCWEMSRRPVYTGE